MLIREKLQTLLLIQLKRYTVLLYCTFYHHTLLLSLYKLSVSISRDATAKVWESLTNKKEKKDFTARQGHRFRACGYVSMCREIIFYLYRFSNFEGYCHFFGVSIPVKWVNKSRQYCYLTKWDCEKWVELRSVKTGSQLITSMAI